ncbi:NADH:flavin oxidoreductase [Alkalibacter rhizosphaerae]|uniref:NADH:flavin oxidoreductase n=1 Tax=Alkalibacter rhizosphaerae TaxID=2815577 RepID=A0A975AJ06_9FIRM|nr:NADH:flavin oxidoreductase [Alkalibacter rhizosphaerae]QSX09219.1 NADH:flavin oxidoreductase [Alkalibacter rhizosphaerae]
MEHHRFDYADSNEFIEAGKKMDADIPFSENIEALKTPLVLGRKTIPNRIVINPMEGCDGTSDGKPDELTYRRYQRFGRSGAGMIWFEATAVVDEGRANPRQLSINKDTYQDLGKLREKTIQAAKETYGEEFTPYTVLQLTHSGRYSKPKGKPAPIVAVEENPFLKKADQTYQVITDTELAQLEEEYVKAAVLAKEIGFDAVDIKSCHGYLLSEILSAHTREGEYGGTLENRMRFTLNVIRKIKEVLGDELEITLRMNAYDAIAYPFGWGVDRADHRKPDLTEPVVYLKQLQALGVKMVNISIGNPYYNPHIGRPYDAGYYIPDEHPMEGVARFLKILKDLKDQVPQMILVTSGLSWLRTFGPNVAAAGIEEGWFDLVGFGRQAFAYPEFVQDAFGNGAMKKEKCCIACSKCSEIMRDGGKAGCVIKDKEIYLDIYRQGKKD